MKVYLVRHAHAGQRSHDGRDIYRQLSPEGQQRAIDLVQVLADRPVDALMTSPATRCVQTLEPLAAARQLPLVEYQELWEGSSIADAISALEGSAVDAVVACSHGDIIPSLVDTLASRGASITGRGCELGSIWALEYQDGQWVSASYVNSTNGVLA